MKYITRGIQNEIVLKLNNTPVNTFSGTYHWACKHIQTNTPLTLILTDVSTMKDNYQKFIISSGDSNNFLIGQYEVGIYDVTASTTLITTEYILAKQSTADDAIYFMANSDTADVYETTNTSIPNVPVAFAAVLQPSGDQVNLTWQNGSPNTQAFEIWRRKASGQSININSNVQSFIYLDQYLDFNETYHYKIRAKNNIGYSVFTPEVQISTSYSATTATTAVYIIGSGLTTAYHVSGNTWIVNTSSSGVTVDWSNVQNKPDLWTTGETVSYVDSQTSGLTTLLVFNQHKNDASIHFKMSGITITESQVTNLVAHLNAKSGTGHTHTTLTGLTINESQVTGLVGKYSLSGHTHDLRYSQLGHVHQISGVTGLQGALNSKSGTGHTHSYTGVSITDKPSFIGSGGTTVVLVGNTYRVYSTPPTGSTVSWSDVTTKPSWLSGNTLSEFQLGHAHSQYATVINLTGHTSDATIHFKQSGITINESQVTNLVTDLAGKSGTGHTHTGIYAPNLAFTNHTGDTSIHFKQSGITINESQVTNLVSHLAGKSGTGHTHTTLTGLTINENQVTNLVTDLAGKSGTGHTHSQYATVVNLTGHTSDTTIHFKQSGITINENQVTNLVTDLAGKSGTGHTHTTLTGLTINESQVIGLVGKYSLSGHTHDLRYSQLGHVHAISGVTGLQGALNSKSNTGHTHSYTGITITDKPSFIGSGNTTVALVGNTYRIYTPTGSTGGGTWGTITGTLSGQTDLWLELQGKASNSAFVNHTGDTTIHFKQSGITISESQVTGLVGKYSLSGHNHTGVYAPNSAFNTFTGNTATLYLDNKAYRGFIDNANIDVSYSWANRQITLTGTLNYYWNGQKKSFVSPKTFTTGHTATVGHWYLASTDGTNFVWSQIPWSFDDIQVAHVYYQATSGATFGVREVHGTMDVEAHEDLHNNIGTYLLSGGKPFAYTGGTASDSAVSPSFASAVVADEDLDSTIRQLDKGSYTLMHISGLTKSVYTLATRPFLAAGVNQYIYVNNTTTGAMTAGQSSRWYNVYQILIPTTSDVPSQKYRMVFLQPQVTYTSLAAAQAENVNGLYLGDLTTSSNEFVIYTRISYAANNANGNYGRVTIPTNGISYNVGNHMSNISIVGGASASNHQNLANLDWLNSGHIGTASTIPAFNATGVAEEVTLVGSGETTVTKVGSTYRIYTPIDTGVSTATFNGYTGTTAPASYKAFNASVTGISATYSVKASDANKIIEANGTFTITLPNGMATGMMLDIVNVGTGTITIAASTTLQSAGTKLLTQYTGAVAYHRGSNVWIAMGKLTV